MKYRLAGKSDLLVSEIGFGCMSLKGTAEENTRLLHQAIDAGINFFDTADIYDHGRNELLLGKALKKKRRDLILATKVGNQWRKDGSGLHWNPRKDHILASVESSLERLQTDYIDLYQLHGGTMDDPLDETIGAFELLRQQGKIRFYGISSIRPNTIRAWLQQASVTTVMMQYSLLDRRPEETCLPLLREHKIGVLARGSLAQGLLVHKPAKAYLNYSAEEVAGAAALIKKLSMPERNEAQTAIRFALNSPPVASAVIGIGNPAQLLEAVNASSSPELSAGEITLLRESLTPGIYEQHR